jgi:diketogulonate reductase-like aldo/keto reductase
LRNVAKRHGVSTAQVALAWLIRQEGIITIPKATTLKHVEDNLAALHLRLTADDLATLDKHFPPPTKAEPLDML